MFVFLSPVRVGCLQLLPCACIKVHVWQDALIVLQHFLERSLHGPLKRTAAVVLLLSQQKRHCLRPGSSIELLQGV